MNKNTSNIFYMPALLTEWMLLDLNYMMSIDLQSEYFSNEFAKDFVFLRLCAHNNLNEDMVKLLSKLKILQYSIK